MSPVRWLHGVAETDNNIPNTWPVWIKYAPSGTTARALSASRAGWALESPDVQRLVRQAICPECQARTPDPRHLVSCPFRAHLWNHFLQRWFPRVEQVTRVTFPERMAVLMAEAPHRCRNLPIDALRRNLWQEALHFPDHSTRRQYWTALLQLFRLLLGHTVPLANTNANTDDGTA